MHRRGELLGRVAAIGVALTLVAAACGGSAKSPTADSRTGSLLPGSPTALPSFDPATFRALLTELRGKPVVVNIWASWCGPCRQEAPELAAVSRAYQGRVQFLGVDIEDQLAPARAFIRQYHWTYPSVFDQPGAIRDSLGLIGVPDTLLFDAGGDRSFVWSGPVTKEILERAISAALGKGTGSSASPAG